MGSLFYAVGMLLVVAWAILYLGFDVGPIVHLLLTAGIVLGTVGIAKSFEK